MFTIYSADVTGNPGNCSYPHKHVILDEDSLKAAICHDYVCAEYKNSYRNGDNFIGSDCLPVDCDNVHSENPDDWVTPDDIMQAFPGVSFAIHYSRYNNREKNGKTARPKFHVLFPIEYVSDASLYSDMKKLVNSIFPYFDTQALDAARFFFGTTTADVALYPGRMNLTEFLDEDLFDEDLPDGQYDGASIPEGSRNATLSRFAGRVIKKYGDSDKAYQAFIEESAKCVPPLEASELATIWHSAQRFYNRGVKSIVWRCISRLESTGLECHARTINELVLQDAVVKAINQMLGDKSSYQAQLQLNIASVIRASQATSVENIDEKLMALQQELIQKAQSKEAYDEIADEIFRLRELRQQTTVDTAARDEQIKRINDLQDYISQQTVHLTEFDESLVRRWVKQITIWDDRITVELKSGVSIDVDA